MEVDSTKESSDNDTKEPAVSDEEKINKLIQSTVEVLVSRDKKELLYLLR